MSVAHITWAFSQTVGSGTRKVVLLALADRCNKDTLVCRPRIATLAKDCDLSERAVRLALDYLCDDLQLIKRERRRAKDGSFRGYDYIFPPVAVHAQPAAPRAGSPAAPRAGHEPEVDLEPEETPLAAAPRKRNETWDALTALFGEATTRTSQTLRGKICRSLNQAGATPSEINARAKRWRHVFPNAQLTEAALDKHWPLLQPPAPKPARAERPSLPDPSPEERAVIAAAAREDLKQRRRLR